MITIIAHKTFDTFFVALNFPNKKETDRPSIHPFKILGQKLMSRHQRVRNQKINFIFSTLVNLLHCAALRGFSILNFLLIVFSLLHTLRVELNILFCFDIPF